ncbi:MAG: hypothetical protein PHE29_14290 [Tissierellia bacterium]|nr:hypothetical protein [Tissierellia bacterium]
MANKVVFAVFVVSMMIIAVALTGCMGASVAPSTSVAGQVLGSNDPYPYLEVGVPAIVDGKCLIKLEDASVRRCQNGEFMTGITIWSNGVKQN